ncbi:hypothetical protein QAD02_016948 [Eretmocerus hayati]|uniref:Uncharacterized protein n=1 Tax=Eretmocerus hayati TaxID=131215 RepID=A0ACC2PEB0_9HYME|nr:hypothetical protein QAD02_016948 [Eretmocerus hayati]
MFFQINVTPKEKKAAARPIRSPLVTNYDLLLAPFQPPTRIKLETKINVPIECKLTIKNSNERSLKACITKMLPPERCVSLSSNEWVIQPNSSVTLDISWDPKESGSWRDTLQLSDSRRLKYDIFLTLNCSDPNQKAKSKAGKLKHKNLAGSTMNLNSNSQKAVPLSQSSRSLSTNKRAAPQFIVQPTEKRTRSITHDASDGKENVPNKIGVNWMLEQARNKKQKRDQSPPPTVDFSKYLNTSEFQFTPLKSNFSCFDSKKTCETVAPRNDEPKNDESWLMKQESSITLESKTKMVLRKETYITVPKYLNVQPNSNISCDKKDDDEFDDSLSPKSAIGEPEKSQSEISKLLDDIKFTPLKNVTLQVNNTEFSPKHYSTSLKLMNKKCSEDNAVNHVQSRNSSFEIDSENNSKNNTYELPSSPKSAGNSFHLKPTCLTETFGKKNLEIEFSTPLHSNHQRIDIRDSRPSERFSRSQFDFGSAKDCLEANLWVKTRNPSLSPISKNLMHSTLDSIVEENNVGDESLSKGETPRLSSENHSQIFKKPKALCIEISPPKKLSDCKPTIRKISPTKNSKVIKEKHMAETINLKRKVQINKSLRSDKGMQIPGVKIANLSLAGLIKNKNRNDCSSSKKLKETSVKLHNPNDFLFMLCNPDPFAATMTQDPFLASTLYYDDKWIFVQEVEFKKWLNLLLSPPEHLTTDVESTKIDVGKVWQSCRAKENVALAETKESMSARYHTNTRLNTLRKAACAMFRRSEVIAVFSQTTIAIEKEILLIRSDKDLHRDIGLQKIILELFISYNPLWLRIGLETIYGETIPLHSNDDIIGLSRFLLSRFFSDPFLVKTHSSNLHPNIRLNTFQPLMNKFMLKKFLFLVYFLDFAKQNKLIGHDPCLFHKKAKFNNSREVLITFSREVLSGIGDITKVLRNYGYTVSYSQTYLDEYDYAVNNLCNDLRDGVRLCRVMELITGQRNITSRCRAPAISRLQKVHNVGLALNTLKAAGYTITGDIDAKCIADGHREKTLSLLWQIIYKFQAPRFEKAAKTLQKWWRSKLMYVYVRKLVLERKSNAAAVIQRSWRCYMARRTLRVLKELYAQEMQQKDTAARIIQSRWRSKREAKIQQKQYQHIRLSVLKIQKWWRRIKETKSHVNELKKKKWLVVQVQRRWRASQMMKAERKRFLKLKENVVRIQKLWRSRRLGRAVLQNYQKERGLVVSVQRKWRAKLLMRRERASYLEKVNALILIQKWWRRCLTVKRDRNRFIELKNAVKAIERIWIAKRIITEERQLFLQQRLCARLIQKNWRSYRATKNDVLLLRRRKDACLKIQTWWRSVSATKNYAKKRSSCVKLQRWWRGTVLTRNERSRFLELRKSAITVQKNWKMRVARKQYLRKKVCVSNIETWYSNAVMSRQIRSEYLRKKSAVKTIESWWCALLIARKVKAEYLRTKNAAIVAQRRWRARCTMKRDKQNYLRIREAVIRIQSWWKMIQQRRTYKECKARIEAAIILQRRWRALKLGRDERDQYLRERSSIILIQRKWRATMMAKSARSEFLRYRKSIILLQSLWRSRVLRKKFQEKKHAVQTIENWRRHQLLGRRIQSDYQQLKLRVIQCQRLWRTKQQMRHFKKQREAVIVLQKYWRSYKASRDYQKTKHAAIVIQRWRRNIVLGQNVRTNYLNMKKSVIKIQSKWRTVLCTREYHRKRNAAIIIQKNWRMIMAMRRYEKLKITVLFVENWRKHILYGRQIQKEYHKMRSTVLKLQNLLRTRLKVKEFQKKRDAAIKIQRYWRSVLKMRECRKQYEAQRCAAIILQRRYRAKKVAEDVRRSYQIQIQAIVRIQSWWRLILRARELEILQMRRRWAVRVIEKWWVQAREELRIREAERAKMRILHEAATKIQAAWRGFRVRQAASKKLALLRERAQNAAKAAVPSATLAFRLQENVEIFKYATNIGQLSICLSSLDVITRLSPNACINVCQMNLVPKLYDILTRANRSLPWLDVSLKDISILLTLAKFPATTPYVLKEEYTEHLARLLTISIDKKDDLFLHTATLIWVLTDDDEYAEAMRNCSRTKYLLSSLYTSINRKLTKTRVNALKCKESMPSPNPDWGLKHKLPRTFSNVSQAITTIASRLRILNINHTGDLSISSNFA